MLGVQLNVRHFNFEGGINDTTRQRVICHTSSGTNDAVRTMTWRSLSFKSWQYVVKTTFNAVELWRCLIIFNFNPGSLEVHWRFEAPEETTADLRHALGALLLHLDLHCQTNQMKSETNQTGSKQQILKISENLVEIEYVIPIGTRLVVCEWNLCLLPESLWPCAYWGSRFCIYDPHAFLLLWLSRLETFKTC